MSFLLCDSEFWFRSVEIAWSFCLIPCFIWNNESWYVSYITYSFSYSSWKFQNWRSKIICSSTGLCSFQDSIYIYFQISSIKCSSYIESIICWNSWIWRCRSIFSTIICVKRHNSILFYFDCFVLCSRWIAFAYSKWIVIWSSRIASSW